MAIQDFSQNLYGDVFKDSANLFKGIATVQANQAALNLARANIVDQNAFLTGTVNSLNNIPSFNPTSMSGGGTGGGDTSGGASAGGLIPVQ